MSLKALTSYQCPNGDIWQLFQSINSHHQFAVRTTNDNRSYFEISVFSAKFRWTPQHHGLMPMTEFCVRPIDGRSVAYCLSAYSPYEARRLVALHNGGDARHAENRWLFECVPLAVETADGQAEL